MRISRNSTSGFVEILAMFRVDEKKDKNYFDLTGIWTRDSWLRAGYSYPKTIEEVIENSLEFNIIYQSWWNKKKIVLILNQKVHVSWNSDKIPAVFWSTSSLMIICLGFLAVFRRVLNYVM